MGAAVAAVALLAVRSGLSQEIGQSVDLVIPWITIVTVVSAEELDEQVETRLLM